MVKQLTQKDVRYGIKHGLDIDGFCAKYDCSQEEFERRINTLYRHDHEEILDEIHGNAKKRNRAGGAKSLLKNLPQQFSTPAAQPNFPIPTAQLSLPTSQLKDNDSPAPSVYPDSNTNLKQDPPSTADQLKLLQTEEREQSDAIIALESEHKSLARQHRDRIRRLRQIQEAMTQIKADFKAKATEYQAVVEENNQLVLQMNQISQSRASQVALLEETRRSIQALTVVVIYIYDNGNIKPAEDASDFKPNENGSNQLYSDLLNRTECEDLRLKDIRVLSRTLSIIKNSDRTIEPVFENERLEEIFWNFQPQFA